MGKWVVVSDSHNDCNGSLKPIIEAAMADGATQVIHCGDIDPINWNAESFCGLPVAVALTDGQVGDDRYRRELVPDNWQITVPGNRVISVFVHLVYLGHKIGWDCLTKSIREVQQKIDLHRKERDALRHMFTGHSHQQFLLRDDLIDLINPGETLGKYQYALMDPDTGEITFTRLPFEPIPRSTVTKVAVIADTEKIAGIDSRFWATFAAALKEHGIAKLVGTKTFGKGSVQEVQPLPDGSSLKLTIAKWLTPNGVEINGTGLEPDIKVELPPESEQNSEKDLIMEKALEVLRGL